MDSDRIYHSRKLIRVNVLVNSRFVRTIWCWLCNSGFRCKGMADGEGIRKQKCGLYTLVSVVFPSLGCKISPFKYCVCLNLLPVWGVK